MSNVDLMRDYLDEIGYRYREGSDSDLGVNFFVSQQGIKGGQTVTIVFEFPGNEKFVSIKILDIAMIDSPLKREELLKLLNELNESYRFGRFTANDNGEVSIDWTVTTINNFDPKLIIDLCVVIVKSLEDEYPKLMKLQWA